MLTEIEEKTAERLEAKITEKEDAEEGKIVFQLEMEQRLGVGIYGMNGALTTATTLRSRGISITMDGKGRWMDNVFIERFWKSIEYEDIYQKVHGSMGEAKKGLAIYFRFYDEKRWHQNFDRKTPAMVYFSTQSQRQAAA